MSILKVDALRCNGCELIWSQSAPRSRVTAPELRKGAAVEGWTYDLIPVRFGLAPSYDFCGACVTGGIRERVLTELVARMIERGQYFEDGAVDS